MKIVFAGTPEFAAIALQSIHKAGFEIPLVLTQPDRPAGRGMQMHLSAVKKLAMQLGISVAQPISLRLNSADGEMAQSTYDRLKEINPDVMVVVAYGLILPSHILAIPRLGCLNIHASLLPRWRGAAPIQRAIEAGDQETGITIMQMDEGLDTGPILMQKRIPIEADENASGLHDKLAALGGEMIVRALRQIQNNELKAQPQEDDLANYAAKIKKEEAALNFSSSATAIANKIRAFNPFPGAHASFQGTPIKIWQAQALPETTQVQSGQVISADAQHGLLVACENSVLRITELQKPGGKRLPAGEFLKGFPLENGKFE